MKISTLLLIILIPLLAFSSCGSSTDANDDQEEPVNPDIYFKMEASGAENFEVEFELPEGVANEYSANGAWTSNVQLFQLIVLDLTPGWQLAIVAANSVGVEEGTYKTSSSAESPDISSFLNADLSESYLSIGGEINISKVESLERPGPGASDYVDGTFEIDFIEADAHPGEIPRGPAAADRTSLDTCCLSRS